MYSYPSDLSDTYGEVSMVAVHPSYQKQGRGETLLAYLERRALLLGITQLFVLSTRTMQWFEERGESEREGQVKVRERRV